MTRVVGSKREIIIGRPTLGVALFIKPPQGWCLTRCDVTPSAVPTSPVSLVP